MPRLLIVEDDLQLARLYSNLLSHAGYEVRTLHGGAQVQQRLLEDPPDALLLDLLLPDIDGWDVLRSIREDTRLNDIPVLVVTARGNDRDITRGFELGANDYLVKPVNLSVLLARVQTQVRLKQARESLRAKNEELRTLSELKGRVVAVVSHELRTPLTSIRGALDLVTRGGGDPERTQRLLAICLRNTDRLIRLISGVLSFARLEAGVDMGKKQVLLQAVIVESIEEIRTLSESRDVELVTELTGQPLIFLGDEDRIHQVLTNLLSNAIKFSEGGRQVKTTASLRGDRLRVEVSDSGPGIKNVDLPLLFLPFSQVHSPLGAGKGGTGLGLSICAEIIRRHGGEIGVISVFGKGSTFWFELPISA